MTTRVGEDAGAEVRAKAPVVASYGAASWDLTTGRARSLSGRGHLLCKVCAALCAVATVGLVLSSSRLVDVWPAALCDRGRSPPILESG